MNKTESETERTNRLAREASPYLLQHSSNPVEWYPWGEEAFAAARELDRPIFLSIGYATCHWCHVMERESFENERVAEVLNREFVSVKVDREERPDVDRLYMAFVQAATGSGGWPMSVWLTPDLKPFFGGTYFPPEDRWGRQGFRMLLLKIAEAWRTRRSELVARAEEVVAMLRAEAVGSRATEDLPGEEVFADAVATAARSFDPEQGGFSAAPKFPRPAMMRMLFRCAARTGDKDAMKMALETLDGMIKGGIHDHLGGGFHRYSVDRYWHVPHFEKMLYDQGQIAQVLVEAWKLTRAERYREAARGIFGYVSRDLGSQTGAWFSAEDADAAVPGREGERAEGAFYVWEKAEIQELLGSEDAAAFCRHYGVEEEGNTPEESDPHGELAGKNTLLLRKLPEDATMAARLRRCREVLFAARARRPRPFLDDKIVTAWNGLMLGAFAQAGAAWGEAGLIGAAARAAEDLLGRGALARSWRGEVRGPDAFAEDYACLVSGLLDLYEATGEVRWLREADHLQGEMDERFRDADGGYFGSGAGDASVLVRIKEDHDGAEPAASSVAAESLARLGGLLDDARRVEMARETVRAFGGILRRMPVALPAMVCALDEVLGPVGQVVLVESDKGMERVLGERFLPRIRVVRLAGGVDPWLAERVPFLGSLDTGGGARALVCKGFVCTLPVEDREGLERALDEGF